MAAVRGRSCPCASEAPARRATGFDCPKGGCGPRGESVDKPRWRSGRWRAVVSRDCEAGVVDASRPPLGRPSSRQVGDELGVSHALRVALDHEIEGVGGDAQRTTRVASDVPCLSRVLAGLVPKRAIEPKGTDAGDVWASIAVDRCQPTGVTVRSARLRRLRQTVCKTRFDSGPLEERGAVEVSEIGCIHDRLTLPATETHRELRRFR